MRSHGVMARSRTPHYNAGRDSAHVAPQASDDLLGLPMKAGRVFELAGRQVFPTKVLRYERGKAEGRPGEEADRRCTRNPAHLRSARWGAPRRNIRWSSPRRGETDTSRDCRVRSNASRSRRGSRSGQDLHPSRCEPSRWRGPGTLRNVFGRRNPKRRSNAWICSSGTPEATRICPARHFAMSSSGVP